MRVPNFSNQSNAVGTLSPLKPSQHGANGIRRARESLTFTGKRKAPTFRGSSLEIQSYRGREFIIAGPRDTSKTWATVWLLDSLLRATPRAQGVLTRKLQITLWGTVIVTYKRIQEWRAAMGDEPAQAYGGEKPEFYTYPNGSKLWVGGMDNPNKMLSGERDFIYINQAEELELNDWEILFSSCTGRGAQTATPMLFGDCNPGAEDHWILKRETLKLYQSYHKDNPSIYDDAGNLLPEAEGRIRDLQSLTGVRKKRLYEGKWVGVEGLFFEEWDEDLHVCKPFPIPEDWPVWLALDYGFAHPTAVMIGTQDGDGKIYVIGEHVQNKWPVNFHCRAIRRLLVRLGIAPRRLRKLVAGHDLWIQRGASDGKTIADQYRDAINPEDDEVTGLKAGEPIGFEFERATIARITGAQNLLTRLGNAQMMIAPKLAVFENCKRLIACIPRMVADPNDAEDIKKVDANAVMGEGGDDEVDSLRYLVMAGVEEARPRQRSYSTARFRH